MASDPGKDDDDGKRERMTTAVKFEQPATLPRLDGGEIHIWHARWEPLAGTTQSMASTLSSEERESADKFRFKKDRDRYVTSRWILRKLLGEYLGVSPVNLQFHYGSHGKPYLSEKSAPYPIHFNVSHSDGLVLFGFSRDHEIGVDLERIRMDYDFEDTARRFLSPGEFTKLISLAHEARPAEFFRLWTRMEAYAKARGIGISLLDDLERSLHGKEESAWEIVCNPHGKRSNWKIEEFNPEPGYVATVAAEFSTSSLKHWKYPNALKQ